MTDRTTILGPIKRRSWATATSVGFGIAFLSFIPGLLVMDLILPHLTGRSAGRA